MYWKTVSVPACIFLSLVPGLAFGASKTRFRRQDGSALGLLHDFCTNFEIKGSKLTALCVASVGVPSEASIDLNKCLSNDDGQLQFER